MNDWLISSDRWLEGKGPQENIVVSSRARHARNIENHTFAPYAKGSELKAVAELIHAAMGRYTELNKFMRLTIPELRRLERGYLRESRLISSELEKGGDYRFVYLSANRRISIMVNEEDHIRMQCLRAGLQIPKAYKEIDKIDDLLSEVMDYAFSQKYGYLTACPTNVGTGLRVSVMLHLPGLAFLNKMEEVIKTIQPYGMVVRGFYGENSDYEGDFYQISNEFSLGKTEERIIETLQTVANVVINKEAAARDQLFKETRYAVEDAIWRSFALLSSARKMDSMEAMKLLSSIRLGLDRGYFDNLSHQDLNRLVISIQPAHLQYHEGGMLSAESRDIVRADFLRKRFQTVISNN